MRLPYTVAGPPLPTPKASTLAVSRPCHGLVVGWRSSSTRSSTSVAARSGSAARRVATVEGGKAGDHVGERRTPAPEANRSTAVDETGAVVTATGRSPMTVTRGIERKPTDLLGAVRDPRALLRFALLQHQRERATVAGDRPLPGLYRLASSSSASG